MEYRKLGRTGLKVSSIGMGGIPLQRVSEQEAEKIVNLALDQGINFFDSARGYTDSEAKFGLVFRKRRREAIIATKSMERTKDGILKDIELSLEALQTDYIDLYQLHNVSTMDMLEQTLGPDGAVQGLKEAQARGTVKYIGITGHVIEVLEKAIRTKEFDTVQFPFNAIETKPFETLIPLAQELQVGMIVMKPVAGGALRDKNLALRYLMDFPVSTIIPGMDSEEQVMANAAIGHSFVPLNEQETQQLVKEAQELGDKFCRRCEYCKPCPQDINIPNIFILDGYWQRYGLQKWAKERYQALPARADSCTECGTCASRCPYGLPIPEMLAEVHRRLG